LEDFAKHARKYSKQGRETYCIVQRVFAGTSNHLAITSKKIVGTKLINAYRNCSKMEKIANSKGKKRYR
jgi:hypothetical protein